MGTTAKKLRIEIAALRDCLERIVEFPRAGQPRRTEDGYPSEIIHDEFAYKRIVDAYREAARTGLAIANDVRDEA